MEKTLEGKIAEDVFRSYYVPLYPKDKPISEMTSTEQGMYKQTISLTMMIIFSIRSLLLEKAPKEKQGIKFHSGRQNSDISEYSPTDNQKIGFNQANMLWRKMIEEIG